MNYCKLCGNEKTDQSDGGVGDACLTLLAASLARPWAFWQECSERNRKCCGGLGTYKDHLYFHGKYWECSYPGQPNSSDEQATEEWKQLHVEVEMGVSFYPDGARTYYLRDFDHYCDSEEYGNTIPYPADVNDEAFWTALGKQLNQAAEFAFSDLLTCPKCGYHFSEVCDCDEDET